MTCKLSKKQFTKIDPHRNRSLNRKLPKKKWRKLSKKKELPHSPKIVLDPDVFIVGGNILLVPECLPGHLACLACSFVRGTQAWVGTIRPIADHITFTTLTTMSVN